MGILFGSAFSYFCLFNSGNSTTILCSEIFYPFTQVESNAISLQFHMYCILYSICQSWYANSKIVILFWPTSTTLNLYRNTWWIKWKYKHSDLILVNYSWRLEEAASSRYSKPQAVLSRFPTVQECIRVRAEGQSFKAQGSAGWERTCQRKVVGFLELCSINSTWKKGESVFFCQLMSNSIAHDHNTKC